MYSQYCGNNIGGQLAMCTGATKGQIQPLCLVQKILCFNVFNNFGHFYKEEYFSSEILAKPIFKIMIPYCLKIIKEKYIFFNK